MIGAKYEKFNFENLLDDALARIPDSIDKREGSIIYDALAPACYQIAAIYMELKNILMNSFIDTAYEEYLDLKVAEQGLIRRQSTHAILKATLDFTDGATVLDVGIRFSSVGQNNISYKVLEKTMESEYLLECETAGSIGNSYIGEILPISHINNLVTARIVSVVTPGSDIESDNDLRDRYKLSLNKNSYGGNIDDYRDTIKGISGVGDTQIYPVWNGGGTVKCSVIDVNYMPLSPEFIDNIQNILDPNIEGKGFGKSPIGHKVTISTATIKTLNITARIQVLNGYTIEQLQEDIQNSINEYLDSLRKNWGASDELNNYGITIYISQIMAAILKVFGVANVSDVQINNSSTDLNLLQNSELQEIPVLGSVIFNGSI